ncbi:putative Iron-sulfur clusters transporter ATM1 [Streptomyces aurantiacus JA 4570]|uniref:Putative Iron-sulfur clusters transporter ATM1 n=1 Tax=Streptomyces aurantiacus JA 4570 TaxID=1286094 RepID=S3ZMJ1_9ACTN|nr:putative Iron-sulfur clusters transporter ATM1 [Streptomyces aurantiacus JA 4570]
MRKNARKRKNEQAVVREPAGKAAKAAKNAKAAKADRTVRAVVRENLAAVRLLIGTAIRVDRRRGLLVLIVSPLLNVVAALQAIGLQWMVDGAVDHDRAQTVRGALLLLVVTVLVHQATAVATDVRLVLQHRVGLEFDRRLMNLCSKPPHIGHYQDPEFLDTAEVVRQRRGEFGGALAAFVENANLLARFVAALVLLITASPLLALLPLTVLPLAAANRWQARLVTAAERAGAEADRRRMALFSLATDPAPAREVRLYRLADEIAARHRDAFAAASGPREAARAKGAIAVAAGWLLFGSALIGGLYVVSRSVIHGSGSAGQAVLVLLLSTRLVGATTGLGWLLGWLRRSLDTVALYLRLVDYPHSGGTHGNAGADARGGADGAGTMLPPRGDLVLEGVSFTYPGRSAPALGPVDLRLPRGATVAVVGDNGAGKSTLVALLAGLQPVSAGRIAFGGQDLSELPADQWRARVTACFQDFCRFELLAREAVGLGDLGALDDPAAVRAALESAGAAEVVAGLSAGLDTQLGRTMPDGTDLSAGQWQKLALARARMRTAPALVLLDEPAASLDPGSEAELLRRYLRGNGPASDTITVIVSHRFSTVRDADLIVVLDGGRIVEQGTHAELFAQGGRYADMYTLHAAAYSTGPVVRSAPAEDGRKVAPGVHTELAVDPGEVALHGTNGQGEPVGDRAVGQAPGGQ